MAILTLLLKDNKDLIISQYAKIYQRESNVQVLQILVPTVFNDIKLDDFTARIEYITPDNIAHADILEKDEELYKDNYFRYTLPVNSEFTYMAGNIVMRLVMTHLDMATDPVTQYILESSEITLTVMTYDDFWAYTPDSTISVIDAKILELENELEQVRSLAQTMQENAAADLEVKEDNLHLINSDNEKLGNGVTIASVPTDDDDGINDGIIHIIHL